jgi:hypothetical protein
MFKTPLEKIKYYAVCDCCNYKALDKSKWNKHLNCEKHKRNGKYKFVFTRIGLLVRDQK